ncbi:hypothetical protein CF328_g8592 [Tilletia controversa]|nr:hypothetical protein CF328_g8592 [Tilletia controversa]
MPGKGTPQDSVQRTPTLGHPGSPTHPDPTSSSPLTALSSSSSQAHQTADDTDRHQPSRAASPMQPVQTSVPQHDKLLQHLVDQLADMQTAIKRLENSPASAPLRRAPVGSTFNPAATRYIPPHLMLDEAEPEEDDDGELGDPFTALDRMSKTEKISLRTGLRRFGVKFRDFVDIAQGRATPPPKSSSPSRPRSDPTPDRSQPDISVPSFSSVSAISGKVPHCRPEFLGTFDGNADELEVFLAQVNDVARSDPDPAWMMAVLRTLPIVMVGDAKAWHTGLTNEEAAEMTTLASWMEAMRESFPVNQTLQRQQARDRKWRPEAEGASAYYFIKLRLLRAAHGQDQSDRYLTNEILDGLPATFLAAPPLTRSNPSSVPALTAPALAPRPPAPQTGKPLGLSSSYDPSRVTEAANGKPRAYRRPDGQLIELKRNCATCGAAHFTFEHDHLASAAQLRVAEVDEEEYGEVDETEDPDESGL